MANMECVSETRGISVLGRRTSSSTNRLQDLGRIGYTPLNEQQTSPPTASGRAVTSPVPRVSRSGGSGSGLERYHIRRSNPTIWTFIFGVAAIVAVLLLTAYTTTRRLGMGAVSTTSYVNVNYYWPYVVHSNDLAFRALPRSRKEFTKTLQSDSPGMRSAIRLAASGNTEPKGPKGPGALINAAFNGANSWPPDAPNWEQCSSRDDPDAMRSSGSVFGYFAMHLQCPVAPTFEPKVKFEPPRLLTSETPRTNQTNPMVLIGIFSGCNSVTRRDTVRQTWARLQYIADGDVQLVFVLANDCESKVAKENAAHQDIIFVDVRESYFTLTPKALALLRYGLQRQAEFIMKTDDDSFIFIDRLVSELKRVRKAQGVTGDEEQQPCLYWGRRCSVPLLSDFNNPKLPLFQTSVSKWYYPPHYLRHFEGTAYMCGAAYLMSASLAAKVLESDDSHHLADEAPFLPEDASVGHLLGPEGWGNCSCHDYRFILDSRRYHGRHLFSPDVAPCKRADIFSSAISAHGLKPEHMHQIINYSNQLMPAASEGPCTNDTTAFSPRNSARSFDEWLWQEELGALQPQFPEINWQKRLEMPPTQPVHESSLIPIQTILKVQHTPWCVRHSWAIQITEQLSYLSEKRNLECQLGMHSIYIDPAHSMQIRLVEDSETLVGYDEDTPFSHGIPCYADNMCDRCFLPESREGIFGALCDPKTWTCKGYDASHQLMVASHKILYPLIGRFVHDTPDPQDMYRSSIESALRIAHLRVTNPSELPRMQARSLRALYERFNGQECTNNWIASMAESGEVGAPFSNDKQHVMDVVSSG